jgi:hypothetical protein
MASGFRTRGGDHQKPGIGGVLAHLRLDRAEHIFPLRVLVVLAAPRFEHGEDRGSLLFPFFFECSLLRLGHHFLGGQNSGERIHPNMQGGDRVMPQGFRRARRVTQYLFGTNLVGQNGENQLAIHHDASSSVRF